MKKKIVTLLLFVTVFVSACGNQTPASVDTEISINTDFSVSETDTNVSAESIGDFSELDALGSIEVDKDLFDVSIVFPQDYVGDKTQADLDQECKDFGYKSITLNEDGSATYVMSKAQHKELLEETRVSINASLTELVGSEDYPNFTAIETNDNFTEFTITTKSTELDFSESFSILMYYMYGGMYAIFSGEEVDNISVTFINADTGNIISESNSSDM